MNFRPKYQVTLVDSTEEVSKACEAKYISSASQEGWVVGVKKANGAKCNRCWFFDNQVGKHGLPYEGICQRCNDAISTWETVKGEKFVLENVEETTTV